MYGLVKKQKYIEILQRLRYFSEPLDFLRDRNLSENFLLN